jgi:transposase-like protein
MKIKDIKEEVKNEIVKLYVDRGMYVGRIAERLGMNIWSIKKILKEKQVALRSPRRSHNITW